MRRMPTAGAVVALAMVFTGLTGCQRDEPVVIRPIPEATGSSGPTTSSGPKTLSKPKASTAPADNGVAALPADEILRLAKAALRDTKSFRIQGSSSEDGQKAAVDFKVRGNDSVGSVSIGAARVELLAVGGERYIRPDKDFWILSSDARQGRIAAEVVGDRWVTGAERDATMAKMFTFGSVDGILNVTGALSKAKRSTIGGVPAIGLRDSGDPDSVLYVATTGRPYPLRVTGTNGGMVFSAFGKPVTGIRKPTARQVVDLTTLAGK